MEIDKLEKRISTLFIDTADQVLVRRKKGEKKSLVNGLITHYNK